MTKADLLSRLTALAADENPEEAHPRADEALLEFINDAEVRVAYDAITKWYE